jgi:hypothetical protein
MFSIYIINQEHRTDRREHMIDLMSRLNIQSYVFVVPIQVVTPVSKASKSQESLFRTVQAILQHHKGAKTHALILEDDIDVNPALSIQQQDIMTHVANTCEGLPNDWDAFKLEICYNICFLSKDISKHVKKTFSSVCAGANIYNVNRIESICDCINAYKPKVIDYAIDRCKPKLNIYYHTPPVFVQFHRFGSDIEGSIKYNPDSAKQYKSECSEIGKWVICILIITVAIFVLYKVCFTKSK